MWSDIVAVVTSHFPIYFREMSQKASCRLNKLALTILDKHKAQGCKNTASLQLFMPALPCLAQNCAHLITSKPLVHHSPSQNNEEDVVKACFHLGVKKFIKCNRKKLVL